MPRLKTALLVLFLCGFALFSFHLKQQLNREQSPIESLKINDPMPDFAVTDLAGKSVAFKQLAQGKKVVAVNFWASWCGPCRMEMPNLEKLYREKNKQGFALFAISEDEAREKLDAYLKEKPVTFPIFIDDKGKVAEELGIKSLPTTVLIGPNGQVVQVTEGVQPYFEFQVDRQLEYADQTDK